MAAMTVMVSGLVSGVLHAVADRRTDHRAFLAADEGTGNRADDRPFRPALRFGPVVCVRSCRRQHQGGSEHRSLQLHRDTGSHAVPPAPLIARTMPVPSY